MKKILCITLAVVLACGLTGCGKKGSLRSPAQIQADQEKAARQAERDAHRKAKEAQKNPPETDAPTQAPTE